MNRSYQSMGAVILREAVAPARTGRTACSSRLMRRSAWRCSKSTSRTRSEPGGIAGDVEASAVGAHDPERRVEPVHLEVVVGVEPAGIEQGSVDRGHHDDARPFVPPRAGLDAFARLAAQLGPSLEDDDLTASPIQLQGRRRARKTSADHHRPSRRHCCPISSCVRAVAISSNVRATSSPSHPPSQSVTWAAGSTVISTRLVTSPFLRLSISSIDPLSVA